MRWIVWVALVGCGTAGAGPIAASTIGQDASDDGGGGVGSSEAGNDASGADGATDKDAGADARVDADAGTLTGTGKACDADMACPFAFPYCRNGHCVAEACIANMPGDDPQARCVRDLGGECVAEPFGGGTFLVCEVRR